MTASAVPGILVGMAERTGSSPTDEDLWFTVDEIVVLFALTPEIVYRLVRGRQIKGKKFPSKKSKRQIIRVSYQSLVEYFEDMKARPEWEGYMPSRREWNKRLGEIRAARRELADRRWAGKHGDGRANVITDD